MTSKKAGPAFFGIIRNDHLLSGYLLQNPSNKITNVWQYRSHLFKVFVKDKLKKKRKSAKRTKKTRERLVEKER